LLRNALPGKGVMPRSRHSSATDTPPVAWRWTPMIWVSALRLFFSRNLLDRAGEKILLMHPINRGGGYRKKAQTLGRDVRRGMIEHAHRTLSLSRQCRLLLISRSSFHYAPQGETGMNLSLMRLIDAQFLETRLEGVRHPFGHSANVLPGNG
jgi:hypothetical protein